MVIRASTSFHPPELLVRVLPSISAATSSDTVPAGSSSLPLILFFRLVVKKWPFESVIFLSILAVPSVHVLAFRET